MKKIHLYTLLLLTLFNSTLWAQEEELLEVDQAFAPEISEVGLDTIKLRFKIADKYYLYKHAFKFPNQAALVKFSEAIIPDGEKKEDEFFGEVETYHHEIEITVPYENPQGLKTTEFKYKYQGCAEAGVCYPPQTKTAQITLPVAQDSLLHTTTSGSGLGLNSNDGWNGQADSVLPEEQAFKVESIAMDAQTLSTRFTMSNNVYLYKDKVKMTSLTPGISLNELNFPQAKNKNDPHFGDVEVFFNQIEVAVALNREADSGNKLELQVEFQGCVDEGICYPPVVRIISIDLPNVLAKDQTATDAKKLSEQDQIQKDLGEKAWWKTILRFFGFGLLLALTPCIFPMIPILSGLIIGQGQISRSRAFMLSLIYVLAMALAYTAAGVIAGLLGANIQAALQKPAVIIAFSAVFIALAMSMFGYYELQLPASWQSKLSKISNNQKSGSYIGVGIMGFLSAIIVGPCVAPPLAGAVLYISNTGDPVVGGFALFAMSMGMGVPLLLIGASAGQWMPQSGGWMNVVKAFFGIALIGMAIWFLSRIIPGPMSLALYGILALLSSIFWYRYALKNGVKGKMIALFLLFKVALIGIGIVEIMGAIRGNSDPLHPLQEKTELEFQQVKSYDELMEIIAQTDKKVLLDFYADWCVECLRMEGSTYSQALVQKELENFLVLKADVTAQDDLDKELMRKFKVIGPPATLFFSAEGKLVNSSSFFGFKNAEEFVTHLKNVE